MTPLYEHKARMIDEKARLEKALADANTPSERIRVRLRYLEQLARRAASPTLETKNMGGPRV